MSSISEFLKSYDLAEVTIRCLYDSRLRLAILDALKDEPMRLADLRRVVNANAPNTSTKAKDLEGMGLIERVEGDFQLTSYGRAVKEKSRELFEFYATYEKFKEFWETHELNDIPDFLLTRLSDLKKSELILDDPTNIRAAVESFYKLIRESKVFWKGVFPVFDPEWAKIGIELFDKSLNFELIVTSPILAGMVSSLSKKEAKQVLAYKKLHFFVIEKEPTLMLGVGDNFFDLGLKLKSFKANFWEADILSFDPRAIQWGLDLFDYYKKQSKPVKLADYL